ncbi:MAG: rhodanese-like domain-containing protein [Pseudomonadota bacterium]
MQQFTPLQLHKYLELAEEHPVLLDVREPWEFKICALADSQNVPMSSITRNLDKLDPARKTVVICHHGMRSMQVALYLEQNGFSDVINLTGGIDRWASEIDRTMPRY